VTEETLEQGFSRVDVLFGGEPPRALVDPTPRIRRLTVLLAVAIPLDLLGITCFTGVPGAFLTLLAYLMADGEVAQVKAGRYPEGPSASRMLRLRTVSAWAMVFTILSFVAQIALFWGGFYDVFYRPVLVRLLSPVG
jgi:hypothetical protein